MPEPTAETCEVKSHGVWIAVSLEAAAIVYGRAIHRCPICHGRVVILGGAEDRTRPAPCITANHTTVVR